MCAVCLYGKGCFFRRYFFTESVKEISEAYGLTENHTTVILSRTRKKLKKYLMKEDIFVKPEKLYESIGAIDEEILERSEKHKEKKRRRGPKWAAAAAVVLAGALAGGILLQPGSGSQVLASCALEEASYPEMADYPNEEDYINKITEALMRTSSQKSITPGGNLWMLKSRRKDMLTGWRTFFIASIREFLSGKEGNRVYSPLNVYMALSMLAELTDGDSRQQILDLLDTEDMETLRAGKGIWNAQYRDEGATTSILASSLWLDQDVDYNSSVLDLLAENYYTSSYQGEMGSSRFSQAYQDWINEQTRGLLEEQSKELKLKEEDILALAATVCFQAKWSEEFNENNTSSQTFHGTSQDITCDFMHSRNQELTIGGSSLAQWEDLWITVGNYVVSPSR